MAVDISHDLQLIQTAARGETVRDAAIEAMKKIVAELNNKGN